MWLHQGGAGCQCDGLIWPHLNDTPWRLYGLNWPHLTVISVRMVRILLVTKVEARG